MYSSVFLISRKHPSDIVKMHASSSSGALSVSVYPLASIWTDESITYCASSTVTSLSRSSQYSVSDSITASIASLKLSYSTLPTLATGPASSSEARAPEVSRAAAMSRANSSASAVFLILHAPLKPGIYKICVFQLQPFYHASARLATARAQKNTAPEVFPGRRSLFMCF